MEPDESSPDRTSRVWGNLGTIVAGAAFFLVAWRVISVAGYDRTTALGIVQAGGAGEIALAGLLATLPALLGAVFMWSTMLIGLGARDGFAFMTDAWCVIPAAIALLCLPFVPWTFFVVAGVWIIPRFVWGRWIRKPSAADAAGSSDPTASPSIKSRAERRLVEFVPVVLGPLALAGLPWLPTEQFTAKHSEPFTGYAVGRQGNTLVVLTDDNPRHLEYLPTRGLRRQLCEPETPWWARELLDLGQEPPYDDCPEN